MDDKNKTLNKNPKSEEVPMDTTEPVIGSQDPNTPALNPDDTLGDKDVQPEPIEAQIPTDEEDALLESAPNSQPSDSKKIAAKRDGLKPKLCGSARKRLKIYLSQGMNEEKARELCLKPMKEARDELRDLKIPRKRGRSDGSTPDKPNPPKRLAGPETAGNSIAKSLTAAAKVIEALPETKGNSKAKSLREAETVTEAQPSRPSYGDVAQVIKLGVIPPDFPATMWSDEKLALVQTAVLDKIVELKKSSVKPQFAGCTFKPGWLIFNCKGENSAQWIREHVPTLKPWSNAVLKVTSEEEAPRAVIHVGYFPEKPDTPTSRILSLIEGQNEDLSVEYWKILNRVSKGNIAELTIAIDPNSATTLKNRGQHIGYGYGTVHIRPINRQHTEAMNDVPKKEKGKEKVGLAKSSKKEYKHPKMSEEKPSCSTTSTKPDKPINIIPKSADQSTKDAGLTKNSKTSTGKQNSLTESRISKARQPATHPKQERKNGWHIVTGHRPSKGHTTSAEEAILLSSNRGRKMAKRISK